MIEVIFVVQAKAHSSLLDNMDKFILIGLNLNEHFGELRSWLWMYTDRGKITWGLWVISPPKCKKEPSKIKKSHKTENWHRLQCKSLFNVADLGQWDVKSSPQNNNIILAWCTCMKIIDFALPVVRSCWGAVVAQWIRPQDVQSWGPWFESAGSSSSALGQSPLSWLPSPLERT